MVRAHRPTLLGVALWLAACGGGGPRTVNTGGAGSGQAGTGVGGAAGGGLGGSAGIDAGGTPGSGGTSGASAAGVGGTVGGGAGGAAGEAAGGTAESGRGGGAAGAGGSLAGTGGSRAGTGGGAAGAAGNGSAGADAGTTVDGGPSGCAGLVCEDFETGSVDANKWQIVAKVGTAAVQQQRVAHGRYALQVHAAATSGQSDDWALLVLKNPPAALQGTTTFGRAYVYVVPDATASIHVQMLFAGRDGSGSGTGPAPFTKLRYLEVASYSGVWQLGFDLLDLSPSVEEVSYSKTRLPTNAWSCLEWELDDRPDHVLTWIDGAEVASFDNTNVAYASPGPIPKPGSPLYMGTSSDLVGGFATFGFGFHDWHPQKTFDIYYDDVVLDSKRVGCVP
jgi:hypothetical protein